MKLRIKTLILVAVAMSSFVGCTKYVDISFEEAGKQQDPQIRRVIIANSIEGVVAKDGAEIQFDEHGGRYDRKGHTISGESVDEKKVDLPFAEVYAVIVNGTGLSGNAQRRLSDATFLREFGPSGWEEFYGRNVQRGDTILVQPSSVKLDTKSRTIAATTPYGSRIDVSPDRVFLQKNGYDGLKTTGLVAGICALTGFAAFVIGMASSGASIP